MLNRLLELLQQGGTSRIRNLADRLGTTPQLVEAMLDDLARMGYLTRISTGCSDKCTACPLSNMCVAGGSSGQDSRSQGLTAWVLTEREREED